MDIPTPASSAKRITEHEKAGLSERPFRIKVTPLIRAELLDASAWREVLEHYARSMKLAVGLVDAAGRLLLPCINPQPVWSMAREIKLVPSSGCPFCLSQVEPCTAIQEASRQGRLVYTKDRVGLVHVTVPLRLDGEDLGALLAGQVFDQFAEQLILDRVAREFKLSPPRRLWEIAHQQRRVRSQDLVIYGELLETLGQTFLKTRYNTIAERERLTQILELMEERNKLERHLQQAQKMESLGTLAGGIAHDFNNILNIIQGYAALGMRRGNTDQAIESFKVIDETVKRGAGVVQQLLTLARKTEPELELTNPNPLVQGLAVLLKETFPKTIEMSVDLGHNVPPVMADPNQITQALLNLCVNARDAMPNGGRLTVKTEVIEGKELGHHSQPTAEQYVCIEVADSGMGIAESVQGRIFEPFFTTKDVGKGTGLGLAVVDGIVKNHSGLIDLRSQPTEGTTFRLYLPVILPEQKPAIERAPKTTLPPLNQKHSGATILVVEDENPTLDVLTEIFFRHGYRVLAAVDGQEAIELYRQNKEEIDVVLLDVGLPKMAGEDVLLKLKEENPEVRVVVASGYLAPELKSRMHQAGVSHFVAKPYGPEEVLHVLRELVA